MNWRRTARIADDIGEEFDELRSELCHYTKSDIDIDQARRLIAEHVPITTLARAQLLLDTMLNYLMADAAEALVGDPAPVRDEFYASDLRSRVKESFTLEPESLKLSLDQRLTYGGVVAGAAATTGGVATMLLLSGFVSRIVGGVATLIVSAFAFKLAYAAATDAARRRLQEDVEGYLDFSERQVSSWLEGVKEFFVGEIQKFRDCKGSVEGETP